MSSLAPLAHAVAPAAPAFNSDFYITIAGVIPVLFLALAVQGPAYRVMMKAIRGLLTPRSGTALSRAGRGLAYAFLWQAAYFIILSGVIGELIALGALYQRHEQPGGRPAVMVMTTCLLFAVATGPLRMLTGRDLDDPQKKAARPVTAQKTAPPEPSAPTEPIAIPETSKTDTGG